MVVTGDGALSGILHPLRFNRLNRPLMSKLSIYPRMNKFVGGGKVFLNTQRTLSWISLVCAHFFYLGGARGSLFSMQARTSNELASLL